MEEQKSEAGKKHRGKDQTRLSSRGRKSNVWRSIYGRDRRRWTNGGPRQG